MSVCYKSILYILIGWSLLAASAVAETTVRLGFFEAGAHPAHDQLHKEFGRQANYLIGPDTSIVFHPGAYRNAGWSRDSSRVMARQMAGIEFVDAIVTMGPWVVEDLLAAGVTKPIIAMYRADPTVEGLVDSLGRPIAPNLTVQIKPGKILNDLATLVSLVPLDTIGFLYFPSGDEIDSIVGHLQDITDRRDITIVYGEGFNNVGTYAFFKGMQQLPASIDALYLGPLWDMDATEQAQFFHELTMKRVPCMTWEGWSTVRLGATFSDAGYSSYADARYNADKLVAIIRGVRPSLLPIEFYGASGLTINQTSVDACNLDLPQDVVAEAQVLEPLVNTDEYIPLSFAVQQALVARPEIGATYDRLDAASAAARQAWSDYLPQVAADVVIDWRNDNGVDRTIPRLDNSGIGARLGVEQTVFSLEAIRRIQTSSVAIRQAEASNRLVRLAMERAVGLAYVNLARAQHVDSLYELYRRQIDLYYEFAATAQALNQGAAGAPLRLQSERQRSTRRLVAARADREAAATLLMALLNQPGRRDFQIDSSLFDPGRYVRDYRQFYPFVTDADARTTLARHIEASARLNHPEATREALDIESYRRRLAQASAAFWPRLSLFADLELTYRYADNPDPFREDNPALTIGGKISLPLLSGLGRFRERSRLKATISEMEFESEAQLLDLSQEAVADVERLIGRMTALPSTQSAQQQASDYLNLTIEAYQADSVGLLTLLDAQQQALLTALESVEHRYRILTNMLDLLYACGWSVRDESGNFVEEFFRLVEPARPGR